MPRQPCERVGEVREVRAEGEGVRVRVSARVQGGGKGEGVRV
jgi:hypothetical protein